MSISDETLLEKLAGNNLELRKHLQQLMGKERFSTAERLSGSVCWQAPCQRVRPSTDVGLYRRLPP